MRYLSSLPRCSGAVTPMRALAVVAVLCVATCKADRITTTDPVVDAAADAWSGGTLVVASPSFTGADSVPLVLLGVDTLVVRSLGPDSVLVQFPDTNGVVTLTLRLRSGVHRSASVRVHGLATVRDGPLLDENALVYPWPGSGNPTAMAIQGGQLVLWNLRTLAVSGPLAPDTGLGCHRNDVGYAPVPSATMPDLVVHFGACVGPSGRLLAVSLAPGAQPPDTGPPGYSEPAVHLSRGKWLASDGNAGFSVFTRTSSGTFTQTPWTGWEALGVVLSPRGDRIAPTFTLCGDPPGTPIYDPATAAVAFHVTAFPCTSGPAAFTAEGDTLFVTGVDSTGLVELVVLDATSGVVLARTGLVTENYPRVSGLAVDPLRPFVYVLGWYHGPYLDVLDRPTLRRVATLRTPAPIAGPLDWQRATDGLPWTIVMSPLDRRLYAIPRTAYYQTLPPYVFTYELMP